MTHEKMHRKTGVSKRTIGTWARGEGRLDFEVVYDTPRLGTAFMAKLCRLEHAHSGKGAA